jgi:hypothetical protein
VVKRTIESGGYEAEFYTDTSIQPPIYHYIITRIDGRDILGMGQERSFPEAERAARECMHDLYQSSGLANAG